MVKFVIGAALLALSLYAPLWGFLLLFGWLAIELAFSDDK